MEHKFDRLSELPEAVVEHILSFIPLKQTLQLTILSKRWQNVWTLFPFPKFDDSNFVSSNLFKILDNNLEQEEAFNYFVERTLLGRYRQKLSINKFNLRISKIDDGRYWTIVNRWIGYAIESNVKELKLCVWPHQNNYHVPESVLVAKSIIKLTLWGCNLESFHSHDINLSSLKKLVLGQVSNAKDHIVQTLIAGCPVVEDIKFARCEGLKNIHVFGLPKLKAIEVASNPELESIEIEASNLESLLILNDRWTLAIPCQINLLACENLKNLKLEWATDTVTDEWLHDVLSKHPLIESLTLLHCNMLERIMISSDRMKSMTFYRCNELVEVTIVTPNLCTLEYCGDAISFSSNTSTLLKVKLRFLGDNFNKIHGTPLNDEKIEFLTKLNHVKLLTWRAHYAKNVITPQKLRKSQPSPLYNVKQLELEAVFIPTKDEINRLVDALLWISPLLEHLSIEWENEATSKLINISFKFSYHESSFHKGANPNCCKLLPVPCWRHCLKTVEIEDFSKSANKETLKKYFSKNAEILESFQYFK